MLVTFLSAKQHLKYLLPRRHPITLLSMHDYLLRMPVNKLMRQRRELFRAARQLLAERETPTISKHYR